MSTSAEMSPETPPGAPDPVIHIVDDDGAVRTALSRVLRAEGYAVEPHSGAAAFVAALEGNDGPGCAVFDLQMPETGGLELQRMLETRGVDLPVIFLTGHGDVASCVEAMKLGAVDFLEKPVQAAELFAAVDRALALDRQRRAAVDARALRDSLLSRLTPREASARPKRRAASRCC